MPEFLTLREAAIKLRLNEKTIYHMLANGILTGFKVRGRGKGHVEGQWRIVDPGEKFQAYIDSLQEHLLHVPLLSSREAAAVMGISASYIRQLVMLKQLKPHANKPGVVHMFTVAEIRRFLWNKEKRHGKRGRQVEIARIIKWARDLLDKERRETAAPLIARDQLYEEIQEIMKLPEPERIKSLQDLWAKLDLVEQMVAVRPLQSQEADAAAYITEATTAAHQPEKTPEYS